jgi:hypothetical protein
MPGRMIVGAVPDQHSGYTTTLETYAVTVTKAIAVHMGNLANQNGIAWRYATGRNRKLRDFVGDGGGYAITWGKMPVTRTVCGDLTLVKNDTNNKLTFPVLSRDKYWRTQNAVGPVQEIDLTTLDLPPDWKGIQSLNLSNRQVSNFNLRCICCRLSASSAICLVVARVSAYFLVTY